MMYEKPEFCISYFLFHTSYFFRLILEKPSFKKKQVVFQQFNNSKKAVPCENSFFNIGTYVLTL